ncbi:MAG: class I SAM-dependent methyltransferase [Candidatus Riflebacteria bacterium]|nr:class I SAM-dependent methyltransferase [Candidatus Riflebacteria bacterium]
MFYSNEDFIYRDPLQLPVSKEIQDAVFSGGAEMSPFQLAFLCGLLKEKKPSKILEVGVSAGGTSCVIMNCLKMIDSNAEFHSVDVLSHCYQDKSKAAGHLMHEVFPKEAKNRWDLRLGHTVAAHLEEIGKGIDFCVLDASHVLPGELLDFIVIFPYLAPDAVLVLHDTSLYLEPRANLSVATRILLSSVCADKIICRETDDPLKLSNIAAFQINSDTGKYINNCFSALALRWVYKLDKVFAEEYRQIIAAKYDQELLEYFDKILAIQNHHSRSSFIARGIRSVLYRIFGRIL